MAEPIRVMIVDDSPLVRKILTDIFSSDPGFVVAATASTAEIALHRLASVAPHLITMDIEMPGMGGLAAISEIMATRATPLIVLSALAQRGAEMTLQALDRGAVDFIPKPNGSLTAVAEIAADLLAKARAAARIDLAHLPRPRTADRGIAEPCARPGAPGRAANRGHRDPCGVEIVAVGTSTGGPPALRTVLSGLPEGFPVPVVVVQHMPPVFTKAFAERLNTQCALRVREAAQGEEVLPGQVYIAPGDHHLSVVRTAGLPRIALDRGPAVNGHRPSVDVMMRAVASGFGDRAVAVIMTGMGRDGADGIHGLRQRGGRVLAQDEASSVIYGMNREVVEAGDADEVVPVQDLAERLCALVDAEGGAT